MSRTGPLAVADRRTVVSLGLTAALRAVGTVLVAEGVARGVAAVAEHGDWRLAVLIGAIGAVLRAVAAWSGTTVGALLGADLTADLRGRLGSRALGAGAPDDTVLLGAHRLDDLQTYCTSVLPALVNAAVVPVVIAARILLADWVSAVVIVVTIPLVPIFMALIGLHTREKVAAADVALERLAAHVVELARGLPVLVGLGRIAEQAAVLHEVSEQHRRRTAATLRVVFLSSLALELVATISVAVVAVAVGLRLLAGDLPLWAGLLALVLAPECYSVLRDVGAAFHAGDDGLAAYGRAQEILARPAVAVPVTTGPAALNGLIVSHEGRGAVIGGLDLRPEPGQITALVGPSGSGKSTVLAAFAGLLDRVGTTVTGTISVPAGGIASLAQQPVVTGTSALDELRLYGDGLDDDRLRGLLSIVGLAPVVDDDPRRLSPGELRRLALARVLARVELGATLVLLDEPTAHLDARNRALVEGIIAGLRGRVTVVLATHEPATIGLADRVVRLGVAAFPAAEEVVEPDEGGVLLPVAAAADETERRGLRGLPGLLRPVSWRLVAGVLLAVGSTGAGLALTGVSGWLIVRASQHPPIMFLLVAIVGVRFFGIGRAVLRYTERLVTHDAVLRFVTVLRDRTWIGLAAHGARSRKLLNGATAIDLLVVAVDQVRDLVPRVLLPPVVAAVTVVGVGVTTALLAPVVLPAMAAGLLVAFLLAPVTAVLVEHGAGASAVRLRGTVARRFSAAVAAADDLRANGLAPVVLARIRVLDDELRGLDRRRALARGWGGALAVLGCSGSAIGVLAVAATVHVPATIVGVLVLIPLAMVEPAQVLVDGVQRLPSLVSAWGRLRPVLRPMPAGGSILDAGTVDELVLEDVGARWAAEAPLVFPPVRARVRRGEWLVLDGPSGAGKSTLLSVLMGALPAQGGRYLLGAWDASRLARSAIAAQVAWLPQDAHVFDSTVRGNLRLGRGDADDQELLAVLDRVGLGALVRSARDGLDLRVGRGGTSLSGGERARLALARTLLSRAPVVLLDEPTAHLDAATAAALMTDLRASLQDRIVVLVSHRSQDRRPEDLVLSLGRRSDAARSTV